MASLLTTQREYRRRLLAADRQTARELVAVYADLERAIQAELSELTRRITQARAAGETVNQSWLFQEQRYRSLLSQAADAYQVASRSATGYVASTQQTASQLGAEAAEQLVRSLAPPQIPIAWSRLPTTTISAFLGYASDGSPLSDLFDALGPEASRGIRSALLRGIGLGYSPRRTARLIRDQVGISLTRALTISRTETIRAYRQSSGDAYRANRDVVVGKRWHAALDDRTCAVCWAGHGTILGLNDSIASHVNCRCTEIPVTRPWSELGIDGVTDTNPTIVKGVDRFAALDVGQQAAILGPGRLTAYQEGVSLPEMIGLRNDRRWGRTAYVLPLRESLRRAGRRAA